MSKGHVRVEALGAVDECNAAIGSALTCELPKNLAAVLQTVQMRLFVVGSELMAPDHAGRGGSVPRLTGQDVTGLEVAIASLEQSLPELRNFILSTR